MAADTSNSNSTIAEHLKWRKPKLQNNSKPSDLQMPSIIQSTGCKSSISSLLLSTFTTNNHDNNNNSKNTPKKSSSYSSSLRGFGCTAQPEVTVPAVIRSSADWDEKDKKKKKKKNKINKIKINNNNNQQLLDEQQIGVQDLWCSADSSAADSVDCVRPRSNGARGKIDLDKLHQRERASYASRQRVNNEQFSGLDLDSAFEIPSLGPDVFEARYYNHLRNRSPEGLAEIIMFQNGLLTSRRSSGADRYRDWRLDVDNMSYEELLELGDRIGHVSTGLGEDQIDKCLRKTKLSVLHELPSQPQMSAGIEGKCSICQEEYEADEEVAKLECEHAYHFHCIEQWLVRKNACPVCKAEASSL